MAFKTSAAEAWRSSLRRCCAGNACELREAGRRDAHEREAIWRKLNSTLERLAAVRTPVCRPSGACRTGQALALAAYLVAAGFNLFLQMSAAAGASGDLSPVRQKRESEAGAAKRAYLFAHFRRVMQAIAVIGIVS